MVKNRLLQLVVVVAMLMAVAASGITASSASADDSSDPFKASVSGTVSITDELTFELAGIVKANHIGNMKGYQANGSFTSPNTDTLTETLTAANGDTLTILCNQTLEELSPGVYRGTDSWTVIGGTGRFSDATGSGTGETTVDLNAGTFTKAMDGVVSY
ncbi:MAG: hypothetical protein KDI02_07730 [Anaerolineae bacterium]|nr:hypothetical protein [Anaerolineae bacterium]